MKRFTRTKVCQTEKDDTKSRLDWSLLEVAKSVQSPASRAATQASCFVIASKVRFWMIQFTGHTNILKYRPLPEPYAVSIPVGSSQFGSEGKVEIESSRNTDEWFALTKGEIWKCKEIQRSNFAPGLQRAWLTAFLAFHEIFPSYKGIRCVVRPYRPSKKACFSLATGTERYESNLLETLNLPCFQTKSFFQLFAAKCVSLIQKLSSSQVGCLYTDYKPSNFVLKRHTEGGGGLEVRLIDAEPNFTFLMADTTSPQHKRSLLKMNLFFFYINCWSLVESIKMQRHKQLDYRRALREAVEPHFKTRSSDDKLEQESFFRNLADFLFDASRFNRYSPLSIIHKYFFWRFERRDLTEKVKRRMRLLLDNWPTEVPLQGVSLHFVGPRSGCTNSRTWMRQMVREVAWCSCLPCFSLESEV